VQTFEIAYEADGERMVGFLAAPASGGTGPAVLVAHEGFGITDNARDRARRLAQLGYVAFALDYHGEGQRRPAEQAMARIDAWQADPTGIRARTQAALDVLCATAGVDSGRIAAIGFCFGGAAVLELARSGADLKAVVGFHPSLRTARGAESQNIVGHVLMLVGTDDPFAPLEHRLEFEREMTAAKANWRMILYGGVQHSFTDPNAGDIGMAGIAYDAAADHHSWRAMLDLFEDTIGRP
jgi:dienelactone hydrolase